MFRDTSYALVRLQYIDFCWYVIRGSDSVDISEKAGNMSICTKVRMLLTDYAIDSFVSATAAELKASAIVGAFHKTLIARPNSSFSGAPPCEAAM